jgi:Tol biopolymer transport system component
LVPFFPVPAAGQSTVRVNVSSLNAPANGPSAAPSISGDGKFVAFASLADNLVPDDANGKYDIFFRDLVRGETTLVSVSIHGRPGNGASGLGYAKTLSNDGKYVVFQSWATDLVPADTNGSRDMFVRDTGSATTVRVSVDSAGHEADADSEGGTISGNGRFVAFSSEADNLVPGDTNAADDVFVHDLVTGQTILVSVGTGGVQGNGDSYWPSLSDDGRLVAFYSEASNLVPGDTNGESDVFVRDLQTGQTILVSVGAAGQPADGYSQVPALSGDGRFVAFGSAATNLVPVDVNGMEDIFVRDLATGRTTLATVSSTGMQSDANTYSPPSISASGRYVTFNTSADDLVPSDQNVGDDVFIRDTRAGQTYLASLNSAGVQANNVSYEPMLSADGRFVVFKSHATNMVLGGDFNGFTDVFVRDMGSPQAASFCAGDGQSGACPCGNQGLLGQGCANSFGSGGASLENFGTASVAGDSLVISCSGVIPGNASALLQSDASAAPRHFGDGLLCMGGHLKRLFLHNAGAGGFVGLPGAGDPAISARSAALGDPILAGATRFYQVYYRDSEPWFCSAPAGNTWNVSSGLSVQWGP